MLQLFVGRSTVESDDTTFGTSSSTQPVASISTGGSLPLLVRGGDKSPTPKFHLNEYLVSVADDECLLRRMYSRLLMHHDCAPLSFSDGSHLLADLSSYLTETGGTVATYADLVILDYEMPCMNGIETAKILRSRGFVGDIVIVSGSVTEKLNEAAKEAGVNAVYSKPISRGLIDRLLLTHLRQAPVRSACTPLLARGEPTYGILSTKASNSEAATSHRSGVGSGTSSDDAGIGSVSGTPCETRSCDTALLLTIPVGCSDTSLATK